VIGRRPDGYHELQSAFVPIDLADLLDFTRRDDGGIERTGNIVGLVESDLALRAAVSLQRASGTHFGATINVEKKIPAGSGMGGGSSDAATTLIALNRLWDLRWPRERLGEIAVGLGADVPFFLGAAPAFVEGIGERLSTLSLEPRDYAVVHPQVAVSTREIFTDPGLTRDTKATIIAAFSAAQETLRAAFWGQRSRSCGSWPVSGGGLRGQASAAFWPGALDRLRVRGVHAGKRRGSCDGGNSGPACVLGGVGLSGVLLSFRSRSGDRAACKNCLSCVASGDHAWLSDRFALGSRQAG